MSRARPRLASCVHAVRVSLVVALLLAIPPAASRSVSDGSTAPTMDQIGIADDVGLRVGADQDANGLWPLLDAEDNVRWMVARTLPAAADVVGYRGPTEAAILLDRQLKIASVTLLDSADTKEHVQAVVEDERFFEQFDGWPWGGPPADIKIDGVSGATLTSMALAQGVLKRIGGARPSLVFPDPLRVDEIRDWFPAATEVDDVSGQVLDGDGRMIGRALRTGGRSDDLIGYQGPTELLIKLGDDDRVEAIRIRGSLDNQPYVDYVRVEAGFWKIFTGQSLGQLADFVPEEAGVEGVSGATMTSLAVADTLVAAARAERERSAARQSTPLTPSWESIRWTRSDVATILMLLAAALLSRAGWFRRRAIRRAWLIAVLVVIGLWSGNLISMALVAGWSAEGVAWRLAPGLSAIVAITVFAPPLAKRNPYCNHLCPHGAVQQLIKPASKSRRRIRLSPAAFQWLSRIPGATLVIAYLALITMPAIDLSSWEPFHAYLFRIAPWGAILLAGISLLVAAVIPMGYCRLGCPTGRLIDYLRRTALSDRINKGDLVAAGLLLFALAF